MHNQRSLDENLTNVSVSTPVEKILEGQSAYSEGVVDAFSRKTTKACSFLIVTMIGMRGIYETVSYANRTYESMVEGIGRDITYVGVGFLAPLVEVGITASLAFLASKAMGNLVYNINKWEFMRENSKKSK